MATSTPNRILREMVDIHYFGERDALAARRRMEGLCAAPLTHAISELLDSWGVPEDQLVSIDRLQVNVTGLTSRDLESKLIAQIISALKAELETKIGLAGSVNRKFLRPVSRSVFEEILFFVEHGYLPWSSGADASWLPAAAEALSNPDAEGWQTLIAVLKAPDARQRFVRHFPAETLAIVLPKLWRDAERHLILSDVEKLLRPLQESREKAGALVEQRLLRILLDAAVLSEADDVAVLCRSLVRQLLSFESSIHATMAAIESAQLSRAFAEAKADRIETGPPKAGKHGATPGRKLVENSTPIPHPNTRERTSCLKLQLPAGADSIYIRNGGLVILAAYLPAFFRKLELANDEQMLDIPTALALQHYLVFGSEECGEWDLVLNKVLCGVPLKHAVEMPLPLAAEQKEEADRLLAAVIANWPALKNTSPDGLRATFLQREGVLRPKGNDWQLLLNRTSFDVLMDRLPWTISMIQLPWMPWLLHTDWAGS